MKNDTSDLNRIVEEMAADPVYGVSVGSISMMFGNKMPVSTAQNARQIFVEVGPRLFPKNG